MGDQANRKSAAERVKVGWILGSARSSRRQNANSSRLGHGRSVINGWASETDMKRRRALACMRCRELDEHIFNVYIVQANRIHATEGELKERVGGGRGSDHLDINLANGGDVGRAPDGVSLQEAEKSAIPEMLSNQKESK